LAQNAPTVVPEGGLLLVVLTEGSGPSATATKAQLDNWIATIKAPYTTTLDATGSPLESYFNATRDTFFIVELAGMKLVDLSYDPAVALDHLQRYLGPTDGGAGG
jgi:hypothetical protein